VIEIIRIAGLAAVQDGGRRGHMHEGVPPGGALVPELLARANAAVRNAPDTAAIEFCGSITLRTPATVVVAADDGVARTLSEGATWSLSSGTARVGYVALRGGLDVPLVLGGRGTLLVAGLGGHHGRALRSGDRVAAGDAPLHDGTVPAPPDLAGPIAVVLGPDVDRFVPSAIDILLGAEFAIDPRSDRTGTRLEGPQLPRQGSDSGPSAPMLQGAIQVPASGQLIVLGPDHPTIGGYPVIATVVRSALGSLSARPFRARVRFALHG
jgi:biotin-dependent carboxylase-like uncharacterized protein